MRNEPNLLEGTTVVLEDPTELSKLKPPQLELLSPAARALFEEFPKSLLQLAGKTTSKSLAKALTRIATSKPCELELHRPGRRGGGVPEVYVRVGNPPILFSGAIEVPSHCPAALAEVLQSVGVLRSQYGCALGLLSPAEQIPLSELAAEYEGYNPGELSELPMPKNPDEFYAFYENSGAYVCVNQDGITWNFSLSGGDYGEGKPIAAWLDAFFDAGPFGPNWELGN